MSGMRIGSVEQTDSHDTHNAGLDAELARANSNSHDDDAEQGPIYIHDHDADAQMEYNEYDDDDAPAANNAHTSHYRHPSLPADQQPAIDDEIENATHNKGIGSTIVHDISDITYVYEPSPSGYEEDKKEITKLRDYWCHASDGIAIEADTDSQPAQQTSSSLSTTHNYTASMNEYTRPFMSKLDDNQHWDTVFGNGIISAMHSKYKEGLNGHLIEWVIEVNNCERAYSQSICIGLSSDLMGGAHSSEEPFTNSQHGFGFDNRGQILHDGKELRTHDELKFEYRDVIHVILDYSSDAHKWAFYAKVGDLEQSDYDDMREAEKNGHVICVFDDITPGSYRLAVSLFSQRDALIIESCKIHGTDAGEFYQELKAYAETIHEEMEDAADDGADGAEAKDEETEDAEDLGGGRDRERSGTTITVTENVAATESEETPNTSLSVVTASAQTVVFKPMESPREPIDEDAEMDMQLEERERSASASVPLNAMQRYQTMEVLEDTASPTAG